MPQGHQLGYMDELGPSFALGRGVASPTITAFAGAAGPNAIRGLTFQPGDSADVVIQFNHDVHVPAGVSVVFDAHVHCTFIAAPTASQTVIWEFEYIGCKPTTDGSASFGSSSATATQSPTYTTDGNELRKHFLWDLGDITIAAADYGSSYILWGNLRMKSTATIGAGKCVLLAFDLHKRVGQYGTAGEYA
jgi:hypothetical protein